MFILALGRGRQGKVPTKMAWKNVPLKPQKIKLKKYITRNILLDCTRKFYIRRNYNKVNSIETERIVIAHLLP